MTRQFLIFGMILLVFIPAKTLFSQGAEEQDAKEKSREEQISDELSIAMTGLSPEQFSEMDKKLAQNIGQKLSKTMSDAGYEQPELDKLDEQFELLFSTLDSLAPDIETTVKSVVSDDEFRAAQERVLIFSQYADFDQVTDSEELNAITGTLLGLGLSLKPETILDLTPEQQKAYQGIQKENLRNLFDFSISMDEEMNQALETDAAFAELNKKIANAKSEEEVKTLQEQVSKVVHEKKVSVTNKYIPKLKSMLKKSREGLQKILTPQQKAKLEKMKENMPKSLWKIMPGNYGKERPWRPDENSWQPGMGVPNDPNAPREAKPAPKEREKPFPAAK
ncbi:MAG: hypothetical protein FWC50_01435 [Planctomycetaceae bacterium]|nr:hypothetical protein [Planctomycetaceae bacterium]